jgi:hypothetical protein
VNFSDAAARAAPASMTRNPVQNHFEAADIGGSLIEG